MVNVAPQDLKPRSTPQETHLGLLLGGGTVGAGWLSDKIFLQPVPVLVKRTS